MNRRISAFLLAAAFAAVALSAQQAAAPPATQPAPAPVANQPIAAPAATQPAAQQPAAEPAGQQADENAVPTLRLGVNEVNLIFTVTDKHGRYIPNIQQSDFALLDDGRAPASVNSFHQQINLPLRVGILIDTSTSIHTRFQFEQQSAIEFLLNILKAMSDRAFVMGFDSTPTVEQNWTNNLDALETGVNRMTPGGGTALFDAVYTACRYKLLDESRGQEPVRKAIVLISDGDDNQSRVYQDEAVKECQRADTILYSISTNWTPSRGAGDKVLTQLAEDTGGQVFFPASVEDMSQSFHNIEVELRSQYALTYTPADFKDDGRFRPIYLYCLDRHYIARTRKGYFAPRQ